MTIACELDPPSENADGSALAFLLEGAKRFEHAGADCITMADNPCAISRGDSLLLASIVQRETGIPVMPHLACRDRNPLSIRSGLLALDIAGVHSVLAVTGDPIRKEDRERILSRAQFSSTELCKRIREWESDFSQPFSVSAALNVNAANFEKELERALAKEDSGAERFLSQPILSVRAADNLALAKSRLSSQLLAGILPIVSHKNALFLDSGISGISIEENIIKTYEGTTKEEARDLAIGISLSFAKMVLDVCDGYYLITPFKRIDIIEELSTILRADTLQSRRVGLTAIPRMAMLNA